MEFRESCLKQQDLRVFISKWWTYQNVIIFGADMSFLVHVDKKKKDVLILGKGPTQELEHTLTAEKMYSITFMRWLKRNFV